MADPIHGLILEAFNNVIKREIAEANEVRAEIAQKGTHWAGAEIWKLRRTVKALRERLAKAEGGES